MTNDFGPDTQSTVPNKWSNADEAVFTNMLARREAASKPIALFVLNTWQDDIRLSGVENRIARDRATDFILMHAPQLAALLRQFDCGMTVANPLPARK